MFGPGWRPAEGNDVINFVSKHFDKCFLISDCIKDIFDGSFPSVIAVAFARANNPQSKPQILQACLSYP